MQHASKRVLGAVLVALVTVLLGSCATPDPTELPLPADAQSSLNFNPLQKPEEVPLLARRELGEDVTVRRITLFDNGFSMEVRDPNKPENLDTYRYDGTDWTSRPVSVSLSDIEALPKTTFRLGAVDWAQIPSLIEQAYAGLDLEEESITAVSYDRISGDPPRVYIGVNGLRGNGRLIANADGTDVKIARN